MKGNLLGIFHLLLYIPKYGQDGEQERSSFSSEMEVAKLSASPNLEVRYVESAKKRCLSSELEETVFSLTHELFMTQH